MWLTVCHKETVQGTYQQQHGWPVLFKSINWLKPPKENVCLTDLRQLPTNIQYIYRHGRYPHTSQGSLDTHLQIYFVFTQLIID